MKRAHTSGNKEFNPETLALGYGYDPALSAGSVKPPVFLTSTFQFASAAEGKRYFELAYGLRARGVGEEDGLIYSRLNNPNLQIFEERVAAWDKTEKAATFASGMAAISTTMLALVEPKSVIVSTSPVYGGTHYLLEHILPRFGVERRFVPAGDQAPAELERVAAEVGPERIRMVFVETPANPSLVHTDIAAMAAITERLGRPDFRAGLVVDNTLLGPLFQRPAVHGADVVLYSATKFLGGHSDLVAGVASGTARVMDRVLESRAILGTSTTPFNGWLLLRSLETVSVRMRRQAKTATKLARVLHEHPRVARVHYPGLLEEGPQAELYHRQCTGPGSLIAFEIDGGEQEAFRVLDRFEVFRLAVSLGGTESLVEHPATMTHADVPPEENARVGVTPGLIRMSVGLEHRSDLQRDLLFALEG